MISLSARSKSIRLIADGDPDPEQRRGADPQPPAPPRPRQREARDRPPRAIAGLGSCLTPDPRQGGNEELDLARAPRASRRCRSRASPAPPSRPGRAGGRSAPSSSRCPRSAGAPARVPSAATTATVASKTPSSPDSNSSGTSTTASELSRRERGAPVRRSARRPAGGARLEPGELLRAREDDLARPGRGRRRRRSHDRSPQRSASRCAPADRRAARGPPRRWRASPRRGARSRQCLRLAGRDAAGEPDRSAVARRCGAVSTCSESGIRLSAGVR